jgi:DHA2 family multidrug resistance protein-like MFS transporter
MRTRAALALLVLPALLIALDMNVLFLALPEIGRDLHASAVQQLWITDVYAFLLAGFVLTMGTLGDRIGRRRLLFLGCAAFAATSVLAAYAPTPELLIAARALMGVAGATLMPSTLALITTLFPDERRRGTALAVWATCQFAGAALGPVAGGLLLAHFWWGSVFLAAVPMAALVIVAGRRLLPEVAGSEAGRPDLRSVALSLATVLPVVWAIKALTSDAGAVPVTVALGVGLGAGVALVRRQLRSAHPLFDLALFRLVPVRVVLGALVGAGIVMAGTGMLVTQYLQTVLGYSPFAAALWFVPMGLGVAAGTLLTPALVRRVDPAAAITGGLVLAAAGAALLVLVPAEDGAAVAVGALAVLALGTGPLFARGVGYLMAAVLSETGNHLGGALGPALLGSLAAGVYRAGTTGLPDAARDTVTGAAAVALGVPGEQAAALLHTAHTASVAGIHVAGLAGAVVFAALAAASRRISAPRRSSPR